jgi:hypothetical protein
MFKNINFKNFTPHLIAIGVFLLITLSYLTPLLNGKEIRQSDMINTKGMAEEVKNFNAANPNNPSLWTTSSFSGMPTYQTILPPSYSNLMTTVMRVVTLNLPNPASLVFVLLLGFYILLSVMRVNRWLSIVGAIAFAFSTYFFTIIEVGHITKALAIAFMAPTFAGVYLLFNRKLAWGFVVFTLFLGLEIYSNHYQITYYFVLFTLIYSGFEGYKLIKAKDYTYLLKAFGVVCVSSVLVVGMSARNIFITAAHTPYTTRGTSDLVSTSTNTTSGLDKDYATQWSYGKAETMSLLIPSFKGYSSSMATGENKSALDDVDQRFKENIAQQPQYWGDQPFTTATYAGAIVVFLFVLGLFIIDGSIKWTVLVGTLLFMMLAWGKNFMGLTGFMLDHFPGYNKFRAVSTALIIVEFTLPLLGILALDKVLKTTDFFKQKTKLPFTSTEITMDKLFYVAFALTGGLSLLYYLMPSLTEFYAEGEYDRLMAQISKDNGAEIARSFIDNIVTSRIALFKGDALRSFIFIALAAGVVYAYVKQIIKSELIVALIIGGLILIDMWPIDKRSLNDKLFVSKAVNKVAYEEQPANTFILKDTDPNFRVLNVGVSTFNDAGTSYYHKSIGGYHGAKLKRYQELIDTRLGDNMQGLIKVLQGSTTDSAIKNAFAQQQILNMLNMKYLIYNMQSAPLLNPSAYGNAWFVSAIKKVTTANDALETMKTFNAKQTAVVEEKFATELQGFTAKPVAVTDVIKMISFAPNNLVYESNSSTQNFAVFSEVYYKEGWNAYIDDKLTPHTSVNYVLRGMILPAGKHKVAFKFEPTVNDIGIKIAWTSSIMCILLIAVGVYFGAKKEEEQLENAA